MVKSILYLKFQTEDNSWVKKTKKLSTSDTPPEPSSAIVFTFTSAISRPVTTWSYTEKGNRSSNDLTTAYVML
jgi:hypothetical protein